MTVDSPLIPDYCLSLVPLDGVMPTIGRAVFHPNTRDRGDRRSSADRRQQARMQKTRRAAMDRRPRTTWENGHNL